MPAGALPGERRGGRQKGTPNKNTVAMGGENLVQLARKYCPEALQTLVDLMKNGESQDIRQKCANALLDRGYGKPGQALMIQGDEAKPIRHEHVILFRSAE